MMDFSLAESQQAVAGLAAEVLTGADPWKELARAGLLDMSQLGVLDTAVLLTEIGKHAPPDSLKALATLMTGALPVLRWGDADLQRELLPGRRLRRANPHRRPPRALQPSPSDPRHHSHDGKITGTKVGVPFAEQSHRILVPASSGSRQSLETP